MRGLSDAIYEDYEGFVFVDCYFCYFSPRLSFRVVCPEVAVTLSTAFKIREKARRFG